MLRLVAFLSLALLRLTFAKRPSCLSHGVNATSCLGDENCGVCAKRGVCLSSEDAARQCPDGCYFETETKQETCSLKRPALNMTAFDETEAIKFVHLSGAAYCTSSSISAWSCKQCNSVPGFTPLKVFNIGKNLQGFYGRLSDGTNLISFRGTDDVEDWITNLDILKVAPYPEYPSAHVHQGFYDAYLKFQDGILGALKESGGSDPVIVTGHSLGGAMATICAFDLQFYQKKTVKAVWTFGEPRGGDSGFSGVYGNTIATHWRVVHHRDIVPHVPLQAQGFYHVAREVWYSKEKYTPGDYTVCDGSGEDRKCSDSLLIATSVDDHLDYLGISIGTAGC